MMSKKKEIYKKFCSGDDSVPIFLRPWWLDIVCGDNKWDVILYLDKKNQVLAALPYIIENKLFLKISRMPPLTPFLGPFYLPYTGTKNAGLYSYENKVLGELIRELPPFIYFAQKFSPAIKNWYPFFLSNFEQTTSYTYILRGIKNQEKVWQDMKNTVRTVIRKAEKTIQINLTDDTSELFRLQESTFARQQKKVPFSKILMQRIHQAAMERQQCQIFIATDNSGVNHAGLLLLWDHHAAYNLLMGVDDTYKNSGAVQLLIWSAIQYASKYVDEFNFEGTMLPRVEPVFRHFGGIRTPYFRISKDKNTAIKLWRIMMGK